MDEIPGQTRERGSGSPAPDPGGLLQSLFAPRLLAGSPLLVSALRLLTAGSLCVAVLLLPRGPAVPVEDPLSPHVAELAPSLSLPLELNEQVEKWMRRYLTDQRGEFERYLQREGLYSEMIRTALRERGMPEDLVYLAAIESGYSPRAISAVSATGMWQFMGPTALSMGLRIDSWVDERRDPVRATGAALDYLQSLHVQFGSWYLAAAAYNAGPGRVARALEVHDGLERRDETVFWEIIDLLPLETREYVPKILAAVLLGQAAETYGFEVEESKPLAYDRVWVPGRTSLRRVAESVDVPLSRIRDLNPQLIQGVTPPEGPYPVRVPQGRSSLLLASMGGRWQRVNVDDD